MAPVDGATGLSLVLNEEKSAVVHLKEPFQFLGFQFRPEHRWQPVANGQPVRIDDLGWFESSEQKPVLPTEIQLPGEQPAASSAEKSVIILGPGITRLDILNQCLAYRYASTGQLVQSRSMERLLQIVALGTPTLSHQFLKAVRRQNITVTMSDQSGRVGLILSCAASDVRPEVLRKQIDSTCFRLMNEEPVAVFCGSGRRRILRQRSWWMMWSMESRTTDAVEATILRQPRPGEPGAVRPRTAINFSLTLPSRSPLSGVRVLTQPGSPSRQGAVIGARHHVSARNEGLRP